MNILEIIVTISLVIVFYTFLGFGIVLYLINRLTKNTKKISVSQKQANIPTLTFLVAAYNEEDCIEEKITNTLSLDYPKNLIQYLFITDGSTDRTNDIIIKYPNITHLFINERQGKIAATKRAMAAVDTEIVVFSDANTIVNNSALLEIVKHYQDSKVGGVACEKKVRIMNEDQAAGAGEGFYWKYESFLKKQDSDFYSVVGAAGELFSIRTSLFEQIPSDSIIEDFYMTMKIAERGNVVRYEPNAYALENPSYSISEEYKRKTRIASGGIQSIFRLTGLLNPFNNFRLTFLYVSHRVLRWLVTPFLLIVILVISVLLAIDGSKLGLVLTISQLFFYMLVIIGYGLRNKKVRAKIFYIPFYFVFMNYAVLVGIYRYLAGNQSVIWEKSKRADP